VAEYVVRVELGASAAPAEATAVLAQLTALCAAADRWAQLEAERGAEAEVRNTALLYNPEIVLRRVYEHVASEDESSEVSLWLNSLAFTRVVLSARENAEPATSDRTLVIPRAGLDAWTTALPRAAQRWLSALVAERFPTSPTLRSLTYSNPLEAVILATGGTALTLGWLLGQIRDFAPRRRIANAAAAEAEDVVRARAQLRKQILQLHASGQLQGTPNEVMSVLGEDPILALQALQRTDASVVASGQPERAGEFARYEDDQTG
jgi:hypothetical protein